MKEDISYISGTNHVDPLLMPTTRKFNVGWIDVPKKITNGVDYIILLWIPIQTRLTGSAGFGDIP